MLRQDCRGRAKADSLWHAPRSRRGTYLLVRAAVAKNEKDGLRDDLQVEAQRPVAQVAQIVFDTLAHLVDSVGFAAQPIDLGPTGDARLDLVANHVAIDEFTVG